MPDAPNSATLIERARRLRPLVLEQAPDTEARTYYSQEIHAAFEEAGFYRMLVPRRYGGFETDLETFYRVIIEIARGDVSTGWCLCLASSHAKNVGTVFGERAQDEVFGDGDFRCPAVAAPAGRALRTAGGWEIAGTWAYCSGAPYATHYLGQTFVAPAEPGGPPGRMLLFIVPREQWTMLDDWGTTLGLRGSGSHSIRIDRARVAEHLVLQNHWLVDSDPSGNPGYGIHGNPLYAGRTLAIFQAGLAALAIGGARGMLDCYEQQIRHRNTQRPPIRPRFKDPDYQLWYGRAIGRVAAAEAALIGLLRVHGELCRRSVEDGIPYTREDDLRLNAVAREALTVAWTAVQDDLFRTGGSSAAAAGQPFERIYRDLSMDWGHFGNTLRDWTARELAHEHLGLVQGAALKPDRVHTAAR